MIDEYGSIIFYLWDYGASVNSSIIVLSSFNILIKIILTELFQPKKWLFLN